MSKNFDQLPAASALTGTETLPLNQGGVTKYSTINAIITKLGFVFATVGDVATAISLHLGAFTHGDIAHANRAALDMVSGTNTGDQTLLTLGLSSSAAAIDDVVNGTIKSVKIGLGGGAISTNTAIGTQALNSNISGVNNFAFGLQALYSNSSGNYNVAIGTSTLGGNTTGSYNIGIGSLSFNAINTGSKNIVIGHSSLGLNASGDDNVSIGHGSMPTNNSGTRNVAIGSLVLYANTTGPQNVAIGYNALAACDYFGYNVAVGDSAGASIVWGFGNCFIGHSSGKNVSQADVSYSIAIGMNSYTTKDNQAVFGASTITETVLRGNVISPALSTGLVTRTTATYTPDLTCTSIIANYAGTMTLTLPSAATYPGRIFTIKTILAQTVVSASANVIPLAGGAASTAILAATAGKFAQIQSDGTSWQTMMAN